MYCILWAGTGQHPRFQCGEVVKPVGNLQIGAVGCSHILGAALCLLGAIDGVVFPCRAVKLFDLTSLYFPADRGRPDTQFFCNGSLVIALLEQVGNQVTLILRQWQPFRALFSIHNAPHKQKAAAGPEGQQRLKLYTACIFTAIGALWVLAAEWQTARAWFVRAV